MLEVTTEQNNLQMLISCSIKWNNLQVLSTEENCPPLPRTGWTGIEPRRHIAGLLVWCRFTNWAAMRVICELTLAHNFCFWQLRYRISILKPPVCLIPFESLSRVCCLVFQILTLLKLLILVLAGKLRNIISNGSFWLILYFFHTSGKYEYALYSYTQTIPNFSPKGRTQSLDNL